MPPADSTRLEVATPERVALSLPVAGLGYRTLAYLVDLALLGFGWMVAFFVLSLLQQDVVGTFGALAPVWKVLVVLAAFAAQWVYWTAWEVAGNGQTPGKRLLRIRVVDEAGLNVGLFASALRNLLRAVDFLPAFYAAGLVTMMVTRRQRRLGDLVSGTVLVRDERVRLDRYTVARPGAAAGAADAPLPPRPLAADELELVLSFLARAESLEPGSREALGAKLAQRLGAPAEWRTTSERAEAFLRTAAHGRS